MTLERLSPEAVRRVLLAGGEVALLDVRSLEDYGRGHVLPAVPAPRDRMRDELPRLVPCRATRLILCDDGRGEAAAAAELAAGLGYGNLAVLDGGTSGWQGAGFRLFDGINVLGAALAETVDLVCRPPNISATDLARRREAGERLLVLDVRPWAEHLTGHVPGATSCPGGELFYRLSDLAPDPATTVVVHCAGRSRSLYGAQSLINAGVPNPVLALNNGTYGWYRAGLPLAYGTGPRADVAPDRDDAGVRAAARRLALACGVREIDETVLADWRRERDRRSLYLLDVRSPEEFAAGHREDAVSAQGVQLVECSDDWIGVRDGRIVLFDDDGVRAPMAASWLRQLGYGEVAVMADAERHGFAAGHDRHLRAVDDNDKAEAPDPATLEADMAASAEYLSWQASLAQEVALDGLVRLEPYRPDGGAVAQPR